MASPQETPIIYRAVQLPVSPTAAHEGIWLIKGVSDDKYRSFIINSTGIVVEQDAITTDQLATALLTKANDADVVKLTGTQSVAGVKTFTSIPVLPATNPTTVNQAVRKGYVDTELALKANDADVVKTSGNQTVDGTKTFTTSPPVPSKSTAAGANPTVIATEAQVALKANDADVVKVTGNQSIAGTKSFTVIPALPATNPTTANQATRKAYVDAQDTALQQQITNLESIVSDGTKVPLPLDCSTNPNYPVSTKGDAYRVTAEGKVGGTSGIDVEVNDTIYCLVDSPGGTQAAVGTNFYITQGNIDKATTAVHGTVKLATPAEVAEGTTTSAVPTIKDVADMVEAVGTDTVTRLRGTAAGTYVSGDVTIAAGTNVTVTQTGQTITVASTNTTYAAGAGLTLSGTTFSLPVTQTGSGNGVASVTQTANGITVDKTTFVIPEDIAWGAQAW